MSLRDYQEAAIDAALARFKAGDRSTLIVMPTGTGKTHVFADIARRFCADGRRVLVLAHRGELLDQAVDKLRAVGLDAEVEQAERRAGDVSVVVASVQSMRGTRLMSWARDAFGLVVVDEAHHAPAESYQRILKRFAKAKVLGVTATPDRLDGQSLRKCFQSCAHRYDLRLAIDDGWLVALRAKRIEVEKVDLASIRTKAGDLDPGQLGEVMEAAEALQGVAKPLVDLAGNRRTIVYAVNVSHAYALARVINQHKSGSARAIDGSASDEVRKETLRAFRAGEFQFLVNCALYIEGYDDPGVSCVAVVRPTMSRLLYVQMVGRSLRLADGKRDALLLDFTGQSGRHRLVGPFDVLAGELVDLRTKLKAERALKNEADVRDVLDEASGWKARGVIYRAVEVGVLWGTNDKQRARAVRRTEAGLCRGCPGATRPGRVTCQACADKRRGPRRERARPGVRDPAILGEVRALVQKATIARTAQELGVVQSVVADALSGRKAPLPKKLEEIRSAAVRVAGVRAVCDAVREIGRWTELLAKHARRERRHLEREQRRATSRKRHAEYVRKWAAEQRAKQDAAGLCTRHKCTNRRVNGLKICEAHRKRPKPVNVRPRRCEELAGLEAPHAGSMG